MRTNSEGRLIALEIALKWLRDQFNSLATAVAALQAANRQQTAAVYGGGGGSGGTAVYVVVTSSAGIAAASGPPPSGTPGTDNLTVYQLTAGTYTTLGASDIYNTYEAATAAAVRVLTVGPNGDGSFTVLGESCT